MKRLLSLVIVILGLAFNQTYAQTDGDTSTLYLVVKTDGGEFYGYILKDDGREILLNTKTIGKIYISKSDIKSIVKVDPSEVTNEGDLKYKDFRSAGPFTTRYYFTNNALPIKKKENYSMLHIFGPEVHFAVADNFSLGVMASWIGSPIALASKYSFTPNKESDFHLAAGTILGSSGYLANAEMYGGLHWVTATKGNRLKNISLSAGYGWAYLTSWVFEIGEKYDFSNPPYAVYDYNAELAIRQAVYPSDDGGYPETEYIARGNQGAIVLGLAGIAPVGKNASFIFDVMGFWGKNKDVVYKPYDIEVTFKDNSGLEVTKTYTIGKGEAYVTDNWVQTFVLMPAMRFNRAHGKSFQVSLSGVIQQNEGKLTTFPIPMVSWLRQF